ncbi:MAG TPA: response regulator [Steroidobacteraceae bacterium]|nr:response regulator [Steroidobacteraceae bacterium]
MHRVLVVEDDSAMRKVLRMLFEAEDFRVICAETCELGVRQAKFHRPDICIVDLGLPDRDGLTFIRELRSWSATPVVVLTACSDEAQRLDAFAAGADDYVAKPFSCPELVARVRAILRRATVREPNAPTLKLGTTSIDLARRVTHGRDGTEKHLTPIEHRILECLLRRAGGVVPHTEMLREVWGPHQSDMRPLRVYITSLRRKLETDPVRPRHILTAPGIGYRLESGA